jgi:hypothetical protein
VAEPVGSRERTGGAPEKGVREPRLLLVVAVIVIAGGGGGGGATMLVIQRDCTVSGKPAVEKDNEDEEGKED